MSIQLRELIAANCIVDGVHLAVRYPGSSRAEPSLNPKYFELSTDQQAHAYISYIIVFSMPSSNQLTIIIVTNLLQIKVPVYVFDDYTNKTTSKTDHEGCFEVELQLV